LHLSDCDSLVKLGLVHLHNSLPLLHHAPDPLCGFFLSSLFLSSALLDCLVFHPKGILRASLKLLLPSQLVLETMPRDLFAPPLRLANLLGSLPVVPLSHRGILGTLMVHLPLSRLAFGSSAMCL
jgi:hypothetical protein